MKASIDGVARIALGVNVYQWPAIFKCNNCMYYIIQTEQVDSCVYKI